MDCPSLVASVFENGENIGADDPISQVVVEENEVPVREKFCIRAMALCPTAACVEMSVIWLVVTLFPSE